MVIELHIAQPVLCKLKYLVYVIPQGSLRRLIVRSKVLILLYIYRKVLFIVHIYSTFPEILGSQEDFLLLETFCYMANCVPGVHLNERN